MWKLGFVSNQMVTGKEAEAGRRWSGPGISRSGAGGALKLLLYHTITRSLHAWSWIPHYCVVANGLRAPRVSVSGHLDRFSGLLKFHVLYYFLLDLICI